MTPYEIKTIKTYNLMWDTWENPTSASIMESISTWADDCRGFGSGLTEIWKNKKDFQEYSEFVFDQTPEGFKVDSKWIETFHLSEKVVALWGEIIITINLPIKNIVIDPVRVTGAFKEIDGEMKLVQWHASVADISSDDEVWGGIGAPKLYKKSSILFTDFVGFTKIVSSISPERLVLELNEIFAEFDVITKRNKLEKIKTIGDAYMAAGGLEGENDHAIMAVKTAIDMLDYLKTRNEANTLKWDMRIGIHSGEVVGGTIGSEKLTFDLWGDTVNQASRIESSSEPNRINISGETYDLIKDIYPCKSRGEIEVKGKGMVKMYFVI